MSSPFDGRRDLALDARRDPRYASRQNLALIVDELFQKLSVLVVDVLKVFVVDVILLRHGS